MCVSSLIGFQPDQDPLYNTFVLKTFETSEECEHEVEAFVHLRTSLTGKTEPNIVKFYGSYNYGPHFNVILEYADRGTLEEYFARVPPPSTAQEVFHFWESLLPLQRALGQLHELRFDSEVVQG